MEFRTLGKTNLKVSTVGFGGSALGGVFRRIDESEAIRTVRAALAEGINYFDTAPFYGLTKAEEVLGRALKDISRDKYYLATKVGRYAEQEFDFSAERTHKSVDESLRRLNVDYVDVIQCHDIEYGSLEQIAEETIPALREVVAQGKARFIGITGFPLAIYSPVLSQTSVDVVLSYCHYTLNNTSLRNVLPLFEKHGAGVINASPLGMGLLTDEGPPAWHPAGPEIKAACAKAAQLCREKTWNFAELAVQFSLANPRVQTTLIGMATRDELAQNLRAVRQPLQRDAIEQVQHVLSPIQGKTWACHGQNIIDEDVSTEWKSATIDAHHHFWRYKPEEYGWMGRGMERIRRDFLPPDLMPEIVAAGINGTVAVQARQTLCETKWLVDLAEEHEFIRGVVGWAPFLETSLEDDVANLTKRDKLKGLRHVIHDEPDPNFILRDDFNEGIDRIQKFGLVYDILIFERHLAQTIEFVDRHPDQVFVIDHLAKPRIREQELSPWRKNVAELARRENVSCKLSGMATEASWTEWRESDLVPYLETVLEAFGPRRLLFGSDWPVVLLASGYSKWVSTVRALISRLSLGEQQQIMGGTAIRVYKLT